MQGNFGGKVRCQRLRTDCSLSVFTHKGARLHLWQLYSAISRTHDEGDLFGVRRSHAQSYSSPSISTFIPHPATKEVVEFCVDSRRSPDL
jgi:hypothetical protein